MQTQILNEFIKITPKIRINQGDILKDLSIVFQSGFDKDNPDEAIISVVSLPYAIVVSQECDLEHDYNNKTTNKVDQDKYLPNILVLPAYLANQFKEGTHRGEGVKGMAWNSSNLWKPITQNNNNRFHYINAYEDYQIPNLVIDFKHIYTVNRDFVYSGIDNLYLASICEIYRENISQRYSQYLSRIGLPERVTI